MVTKVNLNLVGEPSGVGGFVLCPRLVHEFAGPPILLQIHKFYNFGHMFVQNKEFGCLFTNPLFFCPEKSGWCVSVSVTAQS